MSVKEDGLNNQVCVFLTSLSYTSVVHLRSYTSVVHLRSYTSGCTPAFLYLGLYTCVLPAIVQLILHSPPQAILLSWRWLAKSCIKWTL